MFSHKKKQLQQICVFATQDEQCQEPAIDKDTLLCKYHNDESKTWPLEMLQQHKKMIKEWNDQQDFDIQRQSIPAKKFDKELIDLLLRQQEERQQLKKKYHITDKYLEIFMKRYKE